MSTNGSKAPISRDEVIRLSTYHAAVTGWYDTSQAAQKSGVLTISVMDMAPYEPLPAGARYKFYVMVNHCGYMVVYYPGHPDRYEVESHDQSEHQRQERELREAVLDTTLWYVTGEGAGYHLGDGQEARAAAIQELLEGEEADPERDGGPVVHPVIRDELPDIYLAPGDESSPAPRALRQWSVSFGDGPYCEVGFFGYEEDGSPALVPVDAEPGSREIDEGELEEELEEDDEDE